MSELSQKYKIPIKEVKKKQYTLMNAFIDSKLKIKKYTN